ncbi:hypothetical protein BD769DRAFT_1578803, partial [Suillus cothurnatus]
MITSDKPTFLLTHRVGFFCPIESNTPSNCITTPSLGLSALLTMLIYPHFSTTLPTAFEAYSSWVSCLDGASELHRATLLLRQTSHCHRHICLDNLAMNMQTKFEHRSTLLDLDETIESYRAAPIRCPINLPLPIPFSAAFKQRSVVSDLDETIELVRAALVFNPPGHSDRLASLNNFPSIPHSRFEQQHGIPSDLNESIELHQATFSFCP